MLFLFDVNACAIAMPIQIKHMFNGIQQNHPVFMHCRARKTG
jgi:hypothetical protein